MTIEEHRHRYIWVKDAPNAYTSHRECKFCGRDPWVEKYNRLMNKRKKK